jgi:hypothetical protein
MSTLLPLPIEYTISLYRVPLSEAFQVYGGVVSLMVPLGEINTGAAGVPNLKFIQLLTGPHPTTLYAFTLNRYSPCANGADEVYLHTPPKQAPLVFTKTDKTVLLVVFEYTVSMYFVAVATLFHLCVGVLSAITPLGEISVGAAGGLVRTSNTPHALDDPHPALL